MRRFLVLSAIVAVSLARPEAGYSYNRPQGGGLLLGGGSNLGGNILGGHGGGGFHGGQSNILGGAGGFAGGQGNILGGAGGGFSGGQSNILGGAGGFAGGQSNILGGAGGGFSGGQSNILGGAGGFGGSAIGGSGAGGFIGGGGGQALIQKHIYVHVPPPEPEDTRPQRIIGGGQATKHYKIIFIKAPSAPAPTPAQVLAAQQNQEKTLIYVLSKKQEDAADITIPTVAPTPPSKPEVYFIRYKTQSQAIGGGGVGHIGGGSHGISSIGGGSIGGGSIGGGSISGGSLDAGTIGGGSISGSSNVGLTSSYGPPGHRPGGPY